MVPGDLAWNGVHNIWLWKHVPFRKDRIRYNRADINDKVKQVKFGAACLIVSYDPASSDDGVYVLVVTGETFGWINERYLVKDVPDHVAYQHIEDGVTS